MSQEKFRSKLFVYIHGDTILIYEHSSHGFMEKLIELAEREYGLDFVKKYCSMCG